MKCGYPITLKPGLEVGCGQCMPCRINHKRGWKGRIALETSYGSTEPGSFLTLTYDDDHLPEDLSVHKKDVQEFLWRLRDHRLFTPHNRFFAVGEYGDKTQRPHYHLLLFGAHPLKYENLYQEIWKNGFTKTGELNNESADYTIGYTTKKLTKPDDERLSGRNPEFASMSRLPPIGRPGINAIVDAYGTRSGSAAIAHVGDILPAYRINGGIYPLVHRDKSYIRDCLGITPNPTGNTLEYMDLDDAQIKAERIKQVKDHYNAQQRADKLFRQSKSSSYRRRSL